MTNSKKFPTITKTKIIISATAVAALIISGIAIKKIGFEQFVKNFGTPCTVLTGVVTYIGNEKSKRLQYVEGKIKDFENEPETINVRKMLNAELQCVELFPFVEASAYRYVLVPDGLWAKALLECKCNKHLKEEHDSINREIPLSKQTPAVKAVIRDNFNRFLNHLQQFEKMIESGVVSEEMLSNYLEPWFDLIKNANDNQKDSVKSPITKEEYTHKKALLEYIGMDVKIPDENLSIIQKNVRDLIKRYPTKFDEIVQKKDLIPYQEGVDEQCRPALIDKVQVKLEI